MKFAIFILLATIVATQALKNLTDAQQSIVADLRAECRLRIGITLKEGVALRDGHFDTATEKQKCYMRCLARLLGNIDDNDVVNEKKIKNDIAPLIGRRRAEEVLKICRNIKGTDACDTIGKIYACHFNQHAAFSL